MLSFVTYKILHLVGAFMVVAGLAARPVVGWVGGPAAKNHPAKKLAAMTHGGGLLIVLVAGFGMLARAHMPFGQPWLIVKIGIWIILGGMIAVAARKPEKAGLIWLTAFALAGLAAYCGIYKFV